MTQPRPTLGRNGRRPNVSGAPPGGCTAFKAVTNGEISTKRRDALLLQGRLPNHKTGSLFQ